MIIYKLNEINKALNELDNELNKELDNGEILLKNKLKELDLEENKINSSDRYSQDGKKDLIKDLRQNKYNQIVELGASKITEIEKIYNKYLEEIRKYVLYDNERKEVRNSKKGDVSLNTEMLHATYTLNSIDDIDFDSLIDLKELYSDSENILKLINIKVKKLLKEEKYSNNNILIQLQNEFEIMSKNYVKELENRKNIYIDRYKTNKFTYKVFPHDLEGLFKINADILNSFFS